MSLTPAAQAAINRFLALKEGWKIQAHRMRWVVTEPDGKEIRVAFESEDAALEVVSDYFSDLNALHRVAAGLTPEQWAEFARLICVDYDDRMCVDIMNAAIRTGEPVESASIYATVAAAMALPASTIAPVLARVCGWTP